MQPSLNNRLAKRNNSRRRGHSATKMKRWLQLILLFFAAASGLAYVPALQLTTGSPLSLDQFIQPDDIISDLSNPQSYNRYSYVLNNPLRYTDPSGHGPQLVKLTYDPATGVIQPGYIDEKFGASIRIAKSRPPDKPTLVVAGELLNAAAEATYDPDVGGIETASLYLTGVGMTILGVVEFVPAGKVVTKPTSKVASKVVARAAERKVAVEAAENVAEMAAAAEARGGTYLLRDPVTGRVMRTGRTRDLARREAQHARDAVLGDFKFEPVHRTDVYSQQRGLEQLLHDMYNPPLNKIRPISPTNPNRQQYLDAAQQFLQGGNP